MTRKPFRSLVTCCTMLLLTVPLHAAAGDAPGWLGVQVSEIPPPLASHYAVHAGVMIDNIVRDGPADRAGIERWDIITGLQGEPAPPQVPDFAESVRAIPPGTDVAISVLRGGTEHALEATLAKRPADWSTIDWKYERSPGDVLREHVRTRGHVLTQDDQGNWVLQDLGDAGGLPDSFTGLFGTMPGVTTRVFTGDDRQSLTVEVENGGETIEIQQEDGGPITVRRINNEGPDQVVDEKTYPDADALREADPEAYDFYRNAERRSPPGLTTPYAAPPGLYDLRIHRLDNLDEELERLRKELDETLKNLSEPPGAGGVTAPRPVIPPNVSPIFPDSWVAPWNETPRDPQYSFRVEEDGRIEVTIRRGDSELVDVYRDQSDLQNRSPQLYERYRRLREPPDSSADD